MNVQHVEGLIRRTLNRIGVDVHRHRPGGSGSGQLSSMLRCHDIDLVLDVGANIGQFSRSLRHAGYRNRLVSFEPLSVAYTQLLRASQHDPLWDVAPRIAIGDREAEIEIHVSGNSVSSSALEMLDTHARVAPDSAYLGSERVQLSRLDTMAHPYVQPETVSFIKIDTQGYEDRVLDGASRLLAKSRGVQLELSLVPLYEGQQLFEALVERMRLLGFSIWAIQPGFSDPGSGRMLQVDAIFFRD